MEHISLRPYVRTPEELYETLQVAHSAQGKELRRWEIGTVLALVVGLAATGPISKVALCLGLMAGMHWIVRVIDYMQRGWFMHHLTLRDLTHPPTVSWDLITGLAACIPRVPPEGAGEGSKAGAPDETPPLH